MSIDHMKQEVEELVNSLLEEHSAIKGVTVGTNVATDIVSVFKEGISQIPIIEFIAATTSLYTISQNLYATIMNQKLDLTVVTVDDLILLIVTSNEITNCYILDRATAELEGLDFYKQTLREFTNKVVAVIETSDYMAEDIFVKIRRALPEALFVGLLTNNGMPIKMDVEDMDPVIFSPNISSISTLVKIILKKTLSHVILEGPAGKIIVMRIDHERLLTIGVPKEKEQSVGKYIVTIKNLIAEEES